MNTSPIAQTHAPRLNHLRGVFLCIAVYLACLAIAWPFAEMGFDDDWSYIRTAQVFAQTGHIVFNGWAAPMLGWQVIWGALFIRLFGFSFTVVKFSMLPVSIGCIVAFYLLLARFGINTRNAVIGTLTLALSPLFLPLSVSFMTDIPGLLAILLSLYLSKRAIDAATPRATILWLGFASMVSLVVGTARQTGWLGALVIVPACAVFLRRRRGVLAASLAFWLASFATVLLCMAWLRHQPYWIANDLIKQVPLGLGMHSILTFYELGGGLLSLLIVVVPVLGIWLPQIRASGRDTPLLYGFVVLLAALAQIASGRPLPWVLHTMQLEFASQRISDLRPGITEDTRTHLWIALVVVVFLTASALAVIGTALRIVRTRGIDRAIFFQSELPWLCIPVTVAYGVLLLPRAMHALIFDRYMLMLAPVLILCLACMYQEWIAPQFPSVSIILLLCMATCSVAGTHDWFAWQRARLAAIAELRNAGIPRDAFYGGVEYDGWTQVEKAGYVNNPFLKNPSGAYKPQPPLPGNDPCAHGITPFTPAIHARYTVVLPPEPCFEPTQFPPVTYTSWIPPLRRTIQIQRIPQRTGRMY